MAKTDFKKRDVNFQPEVYDLIQGECEIRRNGGKGFSLTLNQIVLEYFDIRTPKGIIVAAKGVEAVLTIEEEPA